MRARQLLVILLSLLVATGLAAAYTGGDDPTNPGSGPGGVECTNGADDDGDGLVDDKDPGCVKPYYLDGTENSIYDLDASWVFSGQSAPSTTGPSAFYGWKVVAPSDQPDVDDGGGAIKEAYVQNAGSKDEDKWGGGIKSQASLSITDAGDTDRSGFREIIDTPGEDTSDQCGDGKIQGGEDTLSCPEDAGLPDDAGMSSTTVTDELGSIDGQTVKYDVDGADGLHAREFDPNDDGLPSGWGTATGVCDDSGCSDETEVYDDFIDERSPDFYLKDSQTEVWSLEPEYDFTRWFGTVTDWNVDSTTEEPVTGTNNGDTCDGGNCSMNSVTKCTSSTEKNIYSSSGTKDVTIGDTSKEYETSGTSGYGVNLDDTDQTWSFDVTVDKEPTKTGEETVCSGTGTVKFFDTCTGSINCDPCNDCGKSYYETGSSTDMDTVKESATREYGYYDIFFPRTERFDVNPDSNPSSVDSREGLFGGDSFASGSWSDVVYLVASDRAYFSWPISDDGRQQGNDPAVSQSEFEIEVSSETFISNRILFETFDVDGSNGQGDGYIAISEGSIVGTSQWFLGKEIKTGSLGSFVSKSDVPIPSCDPGYTKCVASVDVSLKNLNNWGSTAPSSGWSWQFVRSNPYVLDKSMGVCMMYKRISGDGTVNCGYDNTPDPSPTPPSTAACGDQPGEWWAYMEGPEVDDSTLDSYPGAQQACIDDRSDCVINGRNVSEGTVMNVASEFTSGFENGEDSPDWEVCLAIPGSGDTHSGDNHDWDGDGSPEDIGGEWYDLDNEDVNSYLRSDMSGAQDLVDSNQALSVDSNDNGIQNASDIDYYWEKNVNPADSTYNPEGNSWGVSLENDCGPGLTGCDDDGSDSSFSGLAFSNFEEGMRDEDYHPQSQDVSVSDPTFLGYFNKISDASDQLQDDADMDTDTYDSSFDSGLISIWEDSDGSEDAADQYAISQNLSTSVSSRGNVYPAGNVYYRDSASRRSNPDSPSVSKTDKVFGNSFAAEASTSFIVQEGDDPEAGDGVWIDPDEIKSRDSQLVGGWKAKLTWPTDITGPDFGLGFDTGDGDPYSFKRGGWIVYGDIYFEGEKDSKDNDGDGTVDEFPESYEGTSQVGETPPTLEPPMCGDDRKEFLLEEIGASSSPGAFDGDYACSDSRDACVNSAATPRIVEQGDYSDTNDPGEFFGRFKRDREVCQQRPVDDFPQWYDQDFKKSYCNQNTLYGSAGVRWFDQDYIIEYPQAVRGAIDDDWNTYLEQEWREGDLGTDNATYEPSRTVFDTDGDSKAELDTDGDGDLDVTPAPTGVPELTPESTNHTVATVGFCGGDDGSEYLTAQRCNARACATDTSVIGVAEEKGSCILDGGKYPQVTSDSRELYRPGESVVFDYGSSTREISCFGGVWYEKWPVVFQQDRMEIGKGETRKITFRVINVKRETATYRVRMEDTDVAQFAEFVSEDGDSFETTVPAQSSKTFQVSIFGGDTSIGSAGSYADLRIQATEVGGEISGEDRAGINIVSSSKTTGGERAANRNVPGIGAIQLLFLALVSALFFFSQS